MKRKSKYFKASAALLSSMLLVACSNNPDSSGTSESAKAESSVINVRNLIDKKVKYDNDDDYHDWESENPISIKLSGSDASFDATAPVIFKNNIVTIKAGGTYVISGELKDGQIVVDAEDKSTVRLVLNGVKIACGNSSAIYVRKAEKTTISLPKGTKNYLTDGKQYVFKDSSEDEPNAALFSKDDLAINGAGTLIVQGNYNNGIASKDDLKITGGTIQIKAVDDGIMGRDLLAVKEGIITIDAGGDGLKSSNDEDASKGIIALEDGIFTIASGKDGIQAESSLWIADGSYNITSGGGSPEMIKNVEEGMPPGPGEVQAETTSTEDTNIESTKGLKASKEIVVGGGTFTIDSSDDTVHSNDSINIAGGNFTIATGDDGVRADTSLVISGGKINIVKSYEGVESQLITLNDGEIHVVASDDGINIGGGNDGSGLGVPPQAAPDSKSNANTNDVEKMLTINGGYVTVNANGDGLDANGSISMTGGTVIVNGPTSNGNGPLDYDGSFEMSGGLLIAVGSSGMAQAASEDSSQNSILMTYPETQKAGTMIHLEGSDGKSIVTYAPIKDYQSVFISSPKLAKGSSYTLFTGGTANGKEIDGLYSDETFQGGTKIVDFTISDSVTWLNESGVTTARSHGPGGNPGDMFKNLDEATREKVKTIMEQERAGTITREEAQKKMAELGVEMPNKGPRQ
ncbi:carbohydrate-binding domain-containing protein [Schinkia sp. CFF1]